MKTKNKALALAEIAIVLCSVFLITLPGIAADQKQETQEVSASEVTTASEDDFILEIYGNANEDECIDMRDYTYTARIICWLEDETTFADANYDGRISVADMTQIGLIILGRESELTFVDAEGAAKTVSKPIEEIIALNPDCAEAVRTIGAKDRIVGIEWATVTRTVFFPEISELPSVGLGFMPDCEAILQMHPDILIAYAPGVYNPGPCVFG